MMANHVSEEQTDKSVRDNKSQGDQKGTDVKEQNGVFVTSDNDTGHRTVNKTVA